MQTVILAELGAATIPDAPGSSALCQVPSTGNCLPSPPAFRRDDILVLAFMRTCVTFAGWRALIGVLCLVIFAGCVSRRKMPGRSSFRPIRSRRLRPSRPRLRRPRAPRLRLPPLHRLFLRRLRQPPMRRRKPSFLLPPSVIIMPRASPKRTRISRRPWRNIAPPSRSIPITRTRDNTSPIC